LVLDRPSAGGRAQPPDELVKPVNSLTALSFRPGQEVLDSLQFGHRFGFATPRCDLDLGR